MTNERETVVALITSMHSPSRMALRVSGTIAPDTWQGLFCEPWPAHYGSFERELQLKNFAVPCRALCMPEGRSYTREHVFELHFPSNEELSRLILEHLYALGLHPAEPGEFTRRAFLNGRLQLNQAQSVAALIAASDQKQRREAVQMMSSGHGDLLKDLKTAIFTFRRNLEAVIDFPEEPDVEKEDWRWKPDLEILEGQLTRWEDQDARNVEVGVALKVLLLGPANAGKSSLVRALIPGALAVVSHVPGTTLDLVPYGIELREGNCHLYDSPGLKDIENEWDEMSLGRLKERIASFDAYLLIQASDDDRDLDWPELPRSAKMLYLRSKVDLPEAQVEAFTSPDTRLPVSALRGDGLVALREQLETWCREVLHTKVSPFGALRQRLVQKTRQRLEVIRPLLLSTSSEEELAAYELDELLDEIDGLTGDEGGSEALLDGIFRDFCIGK